MVCVFSHQIEASTVYSPKLTTPPPQTAAKSRALNLFFSWDTLTHTYPFNGPFSGTTRVSWYQKGKTNLDFTESRDSEWQWHQLGHMQVCTSLQTDSHAGTPPVSFLQAGCPSCRPTNSVEALTLGRDNKLQTLSRKLPYNGQQIQETVRQ